VRRRNVLKHIGLGLSAGIALPGWLSSCSDDDPVPSITYEGTVAIIGAGAAGLYAADILKASGIKVRIFEASDRAGGRVRTLKSTDKPSESLLFNSQSELSSDFPNELGAAQTIGTDSSWGKIIQELKISTVDLSATTTDNYFLDGALATAAAAAADPDFIAAKSFFDNLASYSGGNVSVQQAISSAGISSRVWPILNSWIGNKYGTSNDRLSAQAIAEGLKLIVRNNTLQSLTDNPVQDALLSKFGKVIADISFNSRVNSINYAGEKIIVSGVGSTSGEPFSEEVDKVIVTVPIPILKTGGITFSPGVPSSKTAALSRMDMDPMFRVLLDFKANFWGTTSGFLYGGVDGPEYFNSGVGRSDVNRTMSVTIGGSKAAEFSLLGKSAIPVLLAELDTIYDGKATLYIRKDFEDNDIAIIQDWSLEPFIMGGVSYVKPGGTNQDRIDLSAPIDNKLFFAGEATDVNGEAGTVNGALLSGERAAQEVIDSI